MLSKDGKFAAFLNHALFLAGFGKVIQSPEGDLHRLIDHWWSSEMTSKHGHF
ncbi:hypothetical protein ECA0527 [Pectobacterium atrosepticum SCRI1043]|uniref:Uncharacterized protein n=1 Tax=Pectobacterium atrosepticum (strain SCRI 1043 / ATCC BAA-672) TaxID=218491 RepID=Q6D9T5_PECAS|nr:hypothetical protein ECA0527 [Pectobacterium atrosepticum SCRI1043]